MNPLWSRLSKPFFVLAPMEDVTDTVFRQIVARCARPDVFFTEFINVDGMNSQGRAAIIHRLRFSPIEHPIVAQVWGMKPEHYRQAARDIVAMGFDGIDINMGCPQRSIVGHGTCAALIENPSLAAEIIAATKEGAGDNIPVSIKTRIGFKTTKTEEWMSFLLSQNIDALTVHGRTAAEMSKVPARWEEIQKAVLLRNALAPNTVIIGNGDVKSREDGEAKVRQYGVDGVMIGRGIFENVFVFDSGGKAMPEDPKARLHLLLDHVRLFDETWGKTKNFAILKKFLKVYVSGFDGASEQRAKLAETTSREEIETIIHAALGI